MRKFAWMERLHAMYRASKCGSERGSFPLRGPLLEEHGEGNGGGGGEEKLTKEGIVKLVNETVNATASRIEKETKKQFTQITETLSSLSEKLGAKKEEPPPAGDEGEGKGKADPKVLAQLADERKARERLEKQVNDLLGENKKTKEDAERRERLADINTAMSKFTFANDGTREMAFEYFSGKIKRSEDGVLVASGKDGDVPFDHFIKNHLEANPNLLAAKSGGGSGASSGEPHRGGGRFDSATIKPGMGSDGYKAAAAALITARK